MRWISLSNSEQSIGSSDESGRRSGAGVLAGGGETGALMRSIDWSKTDVGPIETWPQSLKTAVSILLESRFPMYIAWGPTFVQFYNDGYPPVLGATKHPAAMGLRADVTFAGSWHIIGPMFEGVRRGTALSNNPADVPFALLYRADPGGAGLELAEAVGFGNDRRALQRFTGTR